ncbi:B3 domain-containing protein, DNA-binding pseudobarrel domain protein [Tanacetum coccineum]
MGNKNTHVANVANHDQTNRRVGFVVSKHANGDVNDMNEEEYYRLKLEELANKKLSLFACEEDNVLDEGGKKKKVKKEIVNNEVTTRLKEIIDQIMDSNMKLVIPKTLFESDLKRSQDRLNMPFKQVETHAFLTDEEIRFLGRKTEDAEIDVRLVEPNLQMFKKPMWLKIWNLSSSKNYVLKTNWCDFVEANKKVLKKKATIQVWSFRKDEQLCFAVVRVDEPVVNTTSLIRR